MEENKRLYPISEELFNQKILPIIEGDYIGKGRPPKVSYYQAFCGILYILRTSCPWRDLPPEYGYWHTIYDRFSRGNKRELWAKMLLSLQKEKGITFNEVIIDSTIMKVHRHGGGQKGGQQTKGKSRAGISTKFHAVITSGGHLVEGFLTGGQINDVTVASELSRDIVGCAVIADRGYDSNEFRRELAGNNNEPVIPGRKNRKEVIVYDKEKYKKRGLIERLLGKVKENRRLVVRYEKSDITFLGFIRSLAKLSER
jgi:transposase